jgi:phosphoribosylamine--glycine ligase
MRVLVVGNGAREHALAWKFSRSNRVSGLFVGPGNAGTLNLAENLASVVPDDPESVVRAARENSVTLVVVGPEAPLAAGLVDALTEAGIRAIGPPAASARLEASKSFSKSFMHSYGIPTAGLRSHTDAAALEKHIRESATELVVKKSGLAAGKGVIESADRDVLVEAGKSFLADGDSVVVEERLSGFEVSLFGLSDGTSHVVLPPCTDYKKAGVGGQGPNTGGMGALCPVPWLEPDQLQAIHDQIIEPTYAGLRDAGLDYAGVLYFGVMVTNEGPRLLEYNVRFGDPEAQVVLPLLQNDTVNLFDAIAGRTLRDFSLRVSSDAAVGVVVAAPGYPSDYPRGLEVSSLPDSGLVFHASTTNEDGTIRTGGGRCFTAVGVGASLLEARSQAYALAREITFPGSWFRPDIGGRIFGDAGDPLRSDR